MSTSGCSGVRWAAAVTYNAAVARPDLVKAVVVLAPVSSDMVDNFNKWFRRDGERRALAQRIADKYGSPEKNPEFWRNVSSVNFFDRIAVPVVIHHGSRTTPARSRGRTRRPPRFGPRGRTFDTSSMKESSTPSARSGRSSMRRTVDYLDALMKG